MRKLVALIIMMMLGMAASAYAEVGPVRVFGKFSHDYRPLEGEVFSIWAPGAEGDLALLEGGECQVEGQFHEVPGILDWKIMDEAGTVVASGQENPTSRLFSFSIPNCFEAGRSYEMEMSSGGETHTAHLHVIESTPEMFPRYDHLELLEPAEGVPFALTENTDEDGSWYSYHVAWKEGGYGLVHVHLEFDRNGIPVTYDNTMNPSADQDPEENAMGLLNLSEKMFEDVEAGTITLTQGDQSVTRTFTLAKEDSRASEQESGEDIPALGAVLPEKPAEENDKKYIVLGLPEDYQFADHLDPALKQEFNPKPWTLEGIQFYMPREAKKDPDHPGVFLIADGLTATMQVISYEAEPLSDESERAQRLRDEGNRIIGSMKDQQGNAPFHGRDDWNWHPCTINGLDCIWVRVVSYPTIATLVFEHDGYIYAAIYSGGPLLDQKYNHLVQLFFTSMAPRSSLRAGDDGVIHLSEADSREVFGIEKDSYVQIPGTGVQFLGSREFSFSGANGQDGHVMTVSRRQGADELQVQIYTKPLSHPAKKPIEINGMTGTFEKYDFGSMIVCDVELERDGKVMSATAHTTKDENELAALLGLFSPADSAPGEE